MTSDDLELLFLLATRKRLPLPSRAEYLRLRQRFVDLGRGSPPLDSVASYMQRHRISEGDGPGLAAKLLPADRTGSRFADRAATATSDGGGD